MKQTLRLPAEREGAVWLHSRRGVMPPHCHDELELNLVVRGRAAYLVGEKRYELRRDAAIWLFPAQEHVLLDASPDYAMWIAVFRPRLLQAQLNVPRAVANSATGDPTTGEHPARVLLQASPPGDFCRRLSDQRAHFLAGLCQELAAASDALLFNAGLSFVLWRAWRDYQDAAHVAGRDVHPAVEMAARLLRLQASQDASDAAQMRGVSELARHCGLSPSRLSRVFKAQTGVSLVTFRNRARLERFRVCYGRGGRLSMSVAAREAGFGSYAQFQRAFRQEMGCGPMQWYRN